MALRFAALSPPFFITKNLVLIQTEVSNAAASGHPENLFELSASEKSLIVYLRVLYGRDLKGARHLLQALHDLVLESYGENTTPAHIEGAQFALAMARVLNGEEPYCC